ncbi:MAG: putative peptidoglycan glycosyltransferase FtsW [Chloroflexi bacterium]|nr:putative peptidoglycan glycosyltransferase FtsW [Chloroflexota bacterium]
MSVDRAAAPSAQSESTGVLGRVRVPGRAAAARSGEDGRHTVGRRIIRRLRRPASPPDWVLVLSVLALVFIGLIFVFSSSLAISQELHGNTHHFALRQVSGAGIGLIAFGVLANIDYRRWQRISSLIIGGALVLLMLVLVPGVGHEENGAQRWIQIGSLPALQPSEFAKLAICIYVAAWLAAKGDEIKRIPLGLAPFCFIIGSVGGLIMLEPDLGTFAAISATGVVMFFLAGAALKHMVILFIGGSGVLFLIIGLFGYGLERVRTFFNAEEFAQDAGFQIINLVSTLGSGGLTGVGLGASRQKFFYVPSAHTDGVFAIIGEETGMLGAMIVLAIFGALIYRGIRAGMRAEDRFGTLLAFGIVAWFALQAFFNIAGVTRTIVLTGIPLPFLSFGSSALIASLAAAGILVSISRYGRGEFPVSADPPLNDAAPTRDVAPRPQRPPKPSPFHSGRGDGG